MAIHARDGQIQGLCSLVAHLGNGSSLGQVHQNEHFSTHLNAEKEETWSRRGTKTVYSESLVLYYFHLNKDQVNTCLLLRMTLPYLATCLRPS